MIVQIAGYIFLSLIFILSCSAMYFGIQYPKEWRDSVIRRLDGIEQDLDKVIKND